MIVTFFLIVGYNFYVFLLGFLPSGTLPSGITSAVSYFVSLMYRFNAVLPIDTLFQVVGAFVAFEAAVFLFNLLQWIYHQVWGSK